MGGTCKYKNTILENSSFDMWNLDSVCRASSEMEQIPLHSSSGS